MAILRICWFLDNASRTNMGCVQSLGRAARSSSYIDKNDSMQAKLYSW